MAVHPDKDTDINLVMPDRQIGVVGVDLIFLNNLGVFGSVICHGDQSHRSFNRQLTERLGFFSHMIGPFPQH